MADIEYTTKNGHRIVIHDDGTMSVTGTHGSAPSELTAGGARGAAGTVDPDETPGVNMEGKGTIQERLHNANAAAGAEEPVVPAKFPMPGYENVPPEPGLVPEYPVESAIISSAAAPMVAAGLGKLGGAIGSKLGEANTNAIARIAARTAAASEAAARAGSEVPAVPASTISKVVHAVSHPVQALAHAAGKAAEPVVDRRLASPLVAKIAAAAKAGNPVAQRWLAQAGLAGASEAAQ